MTKEIQLTQGNVALVDDADFEKLSKFKWGALFNGRRWYAARHNPERWGSRIYMHCQIMGAKGIDHINGDTLDNRKSSNLRIATNQQNNCNRKKQSNNTSGFKGVTIVQKTGRWHARIKYFGKIIHLGNYLLAKDAAIAYDKKAIELFGEFARLNFPTKEYPNMA